MKDRLRIWHLSEAYPPDYGGGAAVTTSEVCRSLADRGHEIRVLCVSGAGEPYSVHTDFDGDIQVDRVSLPYFKLKDPDGWQAGFAGWLRHQQRIDELIRQFLAAWRPDIVDYHTVRPFGEQALKTIESEGISISATLHEAWLTCLRLMLLKSPEVVPCSGPSPLKCLNCIYSHYDGSRLRAALKLSWRLPKLGVYPAYRFWKRSAARRRVNGAVARSEFMAQINRPHLAGRVDYIDLGIDLKGAVKGQSDRKPGPIRFGFVGGFKSTKGIDHLLAAAKSLKEAGFQFELHVWGPGSTDDEARQLVEGLEDRVFLRGMYSIEERWSVFGEIDVALMATKVCEPLGRIPFEAAAVGVPTIGPAVGGVRETVKDEVDGLLYKFLDPKDLERQMKRVLTDPDLLPRLALNLPSIRDSRTAAAALESHYYSVLKAANRSIRAGASVGAVSAAPFSSPNNSITGMTPDSGDNR